MGTRGFRNTKQQNTNEPTIIGDISTTISEIRQKEYGENSAIDIRKYVASKNIEVKEFIPEDSNTSGMLKFENGNWVIYINSKHSESRKRFTIAHEYGHYVLHRNGTSSFLDTTFFRNNDTNSMEYAANRFAAAILMPEEDIRKAISSGTKNFKELASKFNVSSLAVKLRVLDLGYKIKENK